MFERWKNGMLFPTDKNVPVRSLLYYYIISGETFEIVQLTVKNQIILMFTMVIFTGGKQRQRTSYV